MRTHWLFAIALAACGKDVPATADAAGSSDGAMGMPVSGSITADTMWSGAIDLAGATTIQPGVTVTIAAGTTISARTGSSITVAGHLVAQGTSAAKIAMKPASPTLGWLGLTVSGTLEMHYVEETGGGVVVEGGTITVLDTLMSHFHNSQDYLIMSGGMIDVEYSSIIPQAGTTDLIHCDMHANTGGALQIKVVHSNLSGATNGIDFFGGSANLTYNNWFSNGVDVYTEAGVSVTGDVSFGWFEHGAPTAAPGSSITANNLAAAKLSDAGPRP